MWYLLIIAAGVGFKRRFNQEKKECYNTHKEGEQNFLIVAFYFSCLGLNALLALPIKEGGNKDISIADKAAAL